MRSEPPRIAGSILLASIVAASASAGTYHVTSTATSGPTSLNQAILDAATNPGVDTIDFNIPSSDPNCNAGGVCTISPTANLPALPDDVTIDGYSQPGAQANTAEHGSNAVIKIFLSGASDSSPGATGLELAGDNSVVRGLAIGGFVYGVRVPFSSGNKIAGCFVGTDASGLAASPNQWGISVLLASNFQLGGVDPADRNVVSGNTTSGIDLYGSLNALILGTVFGADKTGLSALPNTQAISASGAAPANLTIGGSAAGAGNVISGSSQNGVYITLAPGSAFTMQGNFIGTDAFGLLPLPNAYAGIRIGSSGGLTGLIGGILPGEANVIAHNGKTGVDVDSGAYGVAIRGNSIYDDGYGAFGYGTGIDLSPTTSTTANDEGDGDDGGNGLQNFPIVSGASALPGGGTQVQGVLHSTPNGEFDLDLYENDACLAPSQSFLQGRSYLGTTHVTADSNGTASFDVTLAATIAAGSHVSATATDSQGSTSEFSQRLPWFVSPNSGPAAAGTAITVGGTDFQPGATLTIGGAKATNVNVNTWTSLTGTTPELSPGTLNDIVVTDPDGASGTLEGGFVADFLDVPPSHSFYSFVTELVLNRVTVGVGGGYYGVNMLVSRQQMAVLILKAKHGACYVPPPCTVPVFSDAPCSSPFAPFINQFFAEGITGGCGFGKYCPTDPVRRDQMAPLILKARYGFGYLPPPCQGNFLDVACPSPFADYIEDLAARNVTHGCGGGNYCPSANTTRGQMSVFVIKMFYEF